MNALIVDDDGRFLHALARALQRAGVVTTPASGPEEALALATQHTFRHIVLDLKLGNQSGLALIAPLRSLQPSARIVLLTGYASLATAVEAVQLGADDYLAKPAPIAAILKALRPVDPGMPALIPLKRLQWEHVQRAIHEADGNISRAARALGLHRRSLQRMLAKRAP
jgi:two-component system, response regulator RegA